MSLPGFEGARYIEGVVVAQSQLVPQEHAWVVINEEIIDPTLPEKELTYFPALKWTNGQFHRPFFEGGDMPLFRRLVFLSDGVQVEMDLSRQKAWQFIAARGNSSGGSSAP